MLTKRAIELFDKSLVDNEIRSIFCQAEIRRQRLTITKIEEAMMDLYNQGA